MATELISNPALLTPTVYLIPEIIKYDEQRTIIHVHIPPSAEVYSYKKVIYDRGDLLPKIRIMAQNHAGGQHPWTSMDDQELLKMLDYMVVMLEQERNDQQYFNASGIYQ